MRITILTAGFPRASESFIARQVVSLARLGHHVHVLCYEPGDYALDHTSAAGVTVRCVPVGDPRWRKAIRLVGMVVIATFRQPFFVARLVLHLLRIYGAGWPAANALYRCVPLAGERPDVIHFEYAHEAAHSLALLDLVECPVVVSCRGSDLRVHPFSTADLVGRLPLVFERADVVHCVSHELVAWASTFGADPARIKVIHPAVDPDRVRPTSEPRDDQPVALVSVARVHSVKNHDDGLRAFEVLRRRGYDATYTIAGGGEQDDVDRLRALARELGIEEWVHLAGALLPEDVPGLLHRSDIFLLNSISEGVSNAALEAMSAGLPVVVTDVGGMSEAVRHGVDGFLVPARDPVAMADHVERLIVDPALRRKLGGNARQRIVEAFDERSQTECFVALYEGADQPSTEQTSAARLRLHLGCGSQLLDGWLNLDRRHLPGVIPVNLPEDLARIPDGRVRYIYASHLFEHVEYPCRALDLARHCQRLLAPGGVIRIVVPGIERIIRAYVADDTAFFEVQTEMHPPSCRTKLDHLMYALQGDGHRYGYDFETLEGLLRSAGFASVVLSDYQASAIDDLRVDYRGEGLSLFVEATK